MSFEHELILPNQDLPFRIFLFEGEKGNYVRGRHWHRAVEIFAVFDGELEFYIDEEKYLLSSGKFILVNSNEIHSIIAKKPNRTIVLQIPIQMFGKYCSGDNYIWFNHNSSDEDKKLLALIGEMHQVYAEKKRGYDVEVLGFFYFILYLLVAKYQKPDVTGEQLRRNKNLNKLSAITSYIKEHYTEELTLENVAGHFDYSPTYLSKMFKIYAGITFKTYVQDMRLRYAEKEIQYGKESLTDIAVKYGFVNSRALARTFQKKFDMLPSDYRRTYKFEQK